MESSTLSPQVSLLVGMVSCPESGGMGICKFMWTTYREDQGGT